MRYLIVLMLVGCGQEYNPPVEWSGNITEQSERFILSHNLELKYPRIDKVEGYWIKTQECVGISLDISDNPIIIEYAYGTPNNSPAWADWDNSYIRISPDKYFDEQMHIHEMTHILLDRAGLSNHDNKNHNSIWFDIC